MHSKRRHKICMRSIILGEFESFRNYKSFRINCRCNLSLTKVRSFLFSSISLFWIRKILGFLFLRKIAQHGEWNVKKINCRKSIVWNLLDKLREMYMNGMGIQKFLAVLKQQRNSRPCLLFDPNSRRVSLKKVSVIQWWRVKLVIYSPRQHPYTKPNEPKCMSGKIGPRPPLFDDHDSRHPTLTKARKKGGCVEKIWNQH